jgi:hypothetical protein
MDWGAVAQLGEHLLCKQGVVGSIPISSTKRCETLQRDQSQAFGVWLWFFSQTGCLFFNNLEEVDLTVSF